MAIKLPQRCFSTNIEEPNAAFLAASNKKLAIIPVRGTVGSIFEARERFDRFLRIATVNVDLEKESNRKLIHVTAVEKQCGKKKKCDLPLRRL